MHKRLFVAIDPPQDIRQQLTTICCGLADARWIPPEQLHLTLCFIGEVDHGVCADVRAALGTVTSAPFFLRIQGVGFFPPRGQPRVVWAGIEKNEHMAVLQRKIVTRLFALGLAPENRKFAPHITLARLHQTPAAKVGTYLARHGLLSSAPFAVAKFSLYSSHLGRKGASHLVEQEYFLEK